MTTCRFLFAGFVLVALAGNGRAAERDVRRTFPVQPGCTLKIDSHRGSVIVTEGDVTEMQVNVHLEIGADKPAEVEKLLAGLQLEMKSEGNTVAIHARNPSETRLRWVWEESRQIDLTYRITVPRQCNVDMNVINGSVTIGNLAGRMAARVEKGAIFFRTIDGSVDAQLDNGDLTISRCTGALTAHVQTGFIRTGTIGGTARVKNDSGGVEILVARGALDVKATAGDVAVGFPRQIGGPARLTAAGGSVLARIDPAAACRIEASASWGKIRSTLPLVVEAGASGTKRLTARRNAGGPELELRASGGDVRIEPGETPFD